MTNIPTPSEGLVSNGYDGMILYALLLVVFFLVIIIGYLVRTLVSERQHISEAQNKMSDAMNAVALQMALMNQHWESEHA